MSKQYRIYIRFRGHYCIRFLALGDGILGSDGLDLFEWVRDPQNIEQLRNRCIHTYEIDDHELPTLLARKILENKHYAAWQMYNYENARDMLRAYEEDRARFTELRKGVDKLDAIVSSKDIMTLPRTAPRVGSDSPEWLYLLDVEEKTLEIYGFKDLNNPEPDPTIATTLESNAAKPPGYYIKLELSELNVMWRKDWIIKHQTHAQALAKLWVDNLVHLKSVARVKDLPFSVLYGSIFHGKTSSGKANRRSTRMTRAKLAQAMKMVRNASASSISYHRPRPTEEEEEKHLKYFVWAWNTCEKNPRGIRRRRSRRRDHSP